MNQMILGRYVPYPSLIHHLDPRIKLFGLVVFMSTLFMRFESIYMDFFMYAVTFFIIAMLMSMAHLSFKSLFKQLRALWLMILFLLLINVLIPYSGPVEGYLTLWEGFRVYYGSIAQTFYIVFRLVLMISLTLVLTGTTRPLDLTYAIEWYLNPLKVIRFPTHEIAMTISIALRFIPTLLEETQRIMKAQSSRGVDFVYGKFNEKIRAIVSLIVPLFISAFQRSEELANAMEARGYNPIAKRTRYRELQFHLRDGLSFILINSVLAFFFFVSVSQFSLSDWFFVS
jgi:energy-coupling factor transport system permease protein